MKSNLNMSVELCSESFVMLNVMRIGRWNRITSMYTGFSLFDTVSQIGRCTCLVSHMVCQIERWEELAVVTINMHEQHLLLTFG